jgi:hypothetical protein
MAITKEIKIDKIEIVEDYKHVQVRTATVIKEDGVELSRSFHRHTLSPDADITNEHADVQAVCNAVWTQDVKDAYATFLASQNDI